MNYSRNLSAWFHSFVDLRNANLLYLLNLQPSVWKGSGWLFFIINIQGALWLLFYWLHRYLFSSFLLKLIALHTLKYQNCFGCDVELVWSEQSVSDRPWGLPVGKMWEGGLVFPLLATQPPTCPNKSAPTQSSEGLRLPVVISFPSVTKKGSVFIDLDIGLLSCFSFAVLSKHIALHTTVRLQTVPWGKFAWPKTKKGQP